MHCSSCWLLGRGLTGLWGNSMLKYRSTKQCCRSQKLLFVATLQKDVTRGSTVTAKPGVPCSFKVFEHVFEPLVHNVRLCELVILSRKARKTPDLVWRVGRSPFLQVVFQGLHPLPLHVRQRQVIAFVLGWRVSLCTVLCQNSESHAPLLYN